MCAMVMVLGGGGDGASRSMRWTKVLIILAGDGRFGGRYLTRLYMLTRGLFLVEACPSSMHRPSAARCKLNHTATGAQSEGAPSSSAVGSNIVLLGIAVNCIARTIFSSREARALPRGRSHQYRHVEGHSPHPAHPIRRSRSGEANGRGSIS